MKSPLTHALLIATIAAAVTLAGPERAGAAFSCDPAFEARARSGALDPELKLWIVDTARRQYRDSSKHFPPTLRAACAELGCVSDDDIVAKVAKQCSRSLDQTLERAIRASLPELILPVIGCDARCAMRLGAQ
jgi:hypothetical protein